MLETEFKFRKLVCPLHPRCDRRVRSWRFPPLLSSRTSFILFLFFLFYFSLLPRLPFFLRGKAREKGRNVVVPGSVGASSKQTGSGSGPPQIITLAPRDAGSPFLSFFLGCLLLLRLNSVWTNCLRNSSVGLKIECDVYPSLACASGTSPRWSMLVA